MPDTRIFRITRKWAGYPHDDRPGRVEYGDKRVASAKCGHGGYSSRYGPVVQVEATNAAATDGWADVSGEFLR